MRHRRRVVPWDGIGSGRRGSHIWHQSKARMMKGPGGRRAATAGRRRNGDEGGRPSSSVAEMPVDERPNVGGDATEHGHSATVISA